MNMMQIRLVAFFFVAILCAGCETHSSTGAKTQLASGCGPPNRPTTSIGYTYYIGHQKGYVQLPACPRGCVVRIYSSAYKNAELSQKDKRQTDWAPSLRSQGMIFPRGGFAYFDRSDGILIVANTPEELKLLDPMGLVPESEFVLPGSTGER